MRTARVYRAYANALAYSFEDYMAQTSNGLEQYITLRLGRYRKVIARLYKALPGAFRSSSFLFFFHTLP